MLVISFFPECVVDALHDRERGHRCQCGAHPNRGGEIPTPVATGAAVDECSVRELAMAAIASPAFGRHARREERVGLYSCSSDAPIKESGSGSQSSPRRSASM